EKLNLRVATANSEIDIAKETELKTSEKLNEVNKEMVARRESLKLQWKKLRRQGKEN
ncbi:protein WEAK CHLOROPLAST MOVEMENT UNDER BLUE LIGHT 1, partial [Trifolium medium]|nr:protein WEAK CHLOROPLAST MOVEMENT UNDER BLUE LIGHT 1 [Trifolium medium]